jgi:predicted HTH domain antitoxin
MDTLKVEVEFPSDLLIGLNVPPAEIRQKTREWVALELFREGQVSAGKAAELLGLTKAQFIDLLDERGIPYLDLSPVELAQDVAAAMAAARRPEAK